MKKTMSIILCAAYLLLLLSSCKRETETQYIRTQAYPLSKDQMLLENLAVDDRYEHENVLAYTLPSGETLLRIFSAPIETSENVILDYGDAEYRGTGRYLEKRLPKIWSHENPIKITDIGNTVAIYPAGKDKYTSILQKSVNAFGQTRDTVIYKSAFGAGIDLQCSLTTFGINTEIILSKRPARNTFQIRLMLPESFIDAGSPDYTLFRTAPESGDIRSIVYTPLAVDRSGQWSYSNMAQCYPAEDAENTFIVDFLIDEAFLRAESTRYPVTLNQSIHINKPTQPDTSAYEHTGDIAEHYLSPYMLMGDGSPKGDGWTYVRYEALYSIDISPDKIISAEYVFRNLFDLLNPAEIGVYAINEDWCSINTRWNNRPLYDEESIDQITVRQAGDYKLDITSLLWEMFDNMFIESAEHSIWHSFMIRCDTPNSKLISPSGDNGLFSPFLEIVIAK